MNPHQKFLDLAQKLIARHGREVVFSRLGKGPADSDKPWQGAATPTEIAPVNAVAVFLPDGAGFSSVTTDDELFKSSEQVLLVAPPISGEDLSTYDVVTDQGVAWKINVSRMLQPGALAVLLAMGVSR